MDVNDLDDVKSALAVASLALDQGAIKFDHDKDLAMLFGLLTISVDFTLDGRLKYAFSQATIN